MKKKIILSILLISLVFISGCGSICAFLPAPLQPFCDILFEVFGQQGAIALAEDPDVMAFVEKHPNLEVSIVLLPNRTVARDMAKHTAELGLRPEIKDFIKLELTEGNEKLVVWVDKETKEPEYSRLLIDDPVGPELPKPEPNPNENEYYCESRELTMLCFGFSAYDHNCYYADKDGNADIELCPDAWIRISEPEPDRESEPEEQKIYPKEIKTLLDGSKVCWYGGWTDPFNKINENKVFGECW